MVVKRIGVLSLGKLMGLVYGVFGLIFGLIFAGISMLGGAFAMELSEAGLGILMGMGMAIILPIFYGVLGFLGGMLTAFICNLAMQFAGGLELEVEM